MDVEAGVVFLLFWLLVYGVFALFCFHAAYKKLKEWREEQKKPKLKIIQGGKKERGPYGKGR